MDEVDGKPEHVALQPGHCDTLSGVPTVSLSYILAIPQILKITQQNHRRSAI